MGARWSSGGNWLSSTGNDVDLTGQGAAASFTFPRGTTSGRFLHSASLTTLTIPGIRELDKVFFTYHGMLTTFPTNPAQRRTGGRVSAADTVQYQNSGSNDTPPTPTDFVVVRGGAGQ